MEAGDVFSLGLGFPTDDSVREGPGDLQRVLGQERSDDSVQRASVLQLLRHAHSGHGPDLVHGLGHDLGQHLRLSTARQQIRASRSNVSKPAKTETRPTECGCIPRINV